MTPDPTPHKDSLSDRIAGWLPNLTGITQLVMVTLLGVLAKCGADDYARNVERTKMIKDLTETLTKPQSEANISSQNFALLTLDRLYTNPSLKWYQRANEERQADDSLIFSIAEEMWRVRKALPKKPGDGDVIDQARLDLAARIMQHRDRTRYQSLHDAYEMGQQQKTRSLPDAPLAGTEQPFADLAISATRLRPSPGPAVAGSQVPASAPDTSAVGAGPAAPLDVAPKICYIQFRGFPRPVAQQLQLQFQQRGWLAPGVERVAGKYRCSVRYYFAEDHAKAQKAQAITQAFLASLNDTSRVVLQSLGRRKPPQRVPHGQVEVWVRPADS
ncbi:hypothetical protein [Hymenobacter sp.]|uniref:hypothetical protein n=1 Tax=Hymenobacter sp. TaxID=1898978 RepID=UPI00286C84AE|nr:hypothetical protein [Hymenobacter sp.]